MSIGYKAPTGGWGGESPLDAADRLRRQRLQEMEGADKRREENRRKAQAEEDAACEEAERRGRPQVGDKVEVLYGFWTGFTGTLEEIREGGRTAIVRLDKPTAGKDTATAMYHVVARVD